MTALDRMMAVIEEQVHDERVLRAIRAVPREEFVPPGFRRLAYEDTALSIGGGQTISQPLMVAVMTEELALTGGERVLEVGTGSGYQAAILGRLAAEVVTVERIDELREHAAARLQRLNVTNVRCLPAGSTLGAAHEAPFDAIIVTAASPRLPEVLVAQLADGGRIVIPVGDRSSQQLVIATRHGRSLERRARGYCRFVPLIGEGAFAAETSRDG